MAILHPYNLFVEDVEADHGHAEAFIINEINKLDKNKTKDWVFFYSFSFKSKTLNRIFYACCQI